MAGETDKKPAAEGGEAGLDGGSYEVIRARLVAQAKELADRTHALNARRQQTFGGTELAVVANERVRTENNCVPADILQVGGHLLLGYNVFFGLKKEVVLDDVFSLQSFDAGAPEGQAINPVPAATLPGLLDSEGFVKEFTDLYKYYKDTRLRRLKATETKLFAVFQVSAALEDVKIFHWNVLPRGGVRYVDVRGDREFPRPPSHDFEWTATTREDHVSGQHPHVNIKDMVFVETVGGDLTIKVVAGEHPIMRGFPDNWLDPADELYKNEILYPNFVPLAKAYGEDTKKDHNLIWVNTYGDAKVFGTTMGHGNATMSDPVFLDLVSRGLLWACGKLDNNGKPLPGYEPKQK